MESFEPEPGAVDAMLQRTELFTALGDEVRAWLGGQFSGVRLVTGDVLLREGEEADSVYVVRHGRLRSSVAEGDRSEVIGEIGKGEVVGEMALLTNEPRSATVEAIRDSELYRLSSESFARLLLEQPEVMRPFAAAVVNRLRTTIRRSERTRPPATVAVVPVPDVDVSWLLQSFASQIPLEHPPVVTATAAEDIAKVPAWLLEMEASHDLVVLATDPTPTDWTRQCLRHADRVLLVADTAASTAPTPVESDPECAERMSNVAVDLVMLYERRPATSSWRINRNLSGHHNVRRGSGGDVARVARLVSGRANTLVLGGGGARGFAHLGVLRAIEDRGLEIDAIGGTSAGSIIAAGYAMGHSVDEMYDNLTDFFDGTDWRYDVTAPAVSFLSGKRMTSGLHDVYGEVQADGLLLDYFAVSTNLSTADAFVHDSGPLWQVTRASAAVPGLFPPVSMDDSLLVDGGLVDNCPVGIMRKRHPMSRVIGVDVGVAAPLSPGGTPHDGVVHGFSEVFRRLTGRGTETPFLPRLLVRLTELGKHENYHAADVMIRPALEPYGLLEVAAKDEIIELGYASANEALDASAEEATAID